MKPPEGNRQEPGWGTSRNPGVPPEKSPPPSSRRSLTRFAQLSIAAALVTMALKSFASWTTGSVGLFSDALESLVNLAAALLTLMMLSVAARPPDEEHLYGHDKAEYFASAAEGILILFAALSIVAASIHRFVHPRVLESVNAGLLASGAAAVINALVARTLLRAGLEARSIALESDARHLLSDVWTSVGVMVAVAAVAATGWRILDPLIAILVAALIIWSGVDLMRRSVHGLMDRALPKVDRDEIHRILGEYESRGIEFHALRTRQAGVRRFLSVHVLVPGESTVTEGHDLLEHLEDDLRAAIPDLVVFTHLEPLGEESSMRDLHLDRTSN